MNMVLALFACALVAACAKVEERTICILQPNSTMIGSTEKSATTDGTQASRGAFTGHRTEKGQDTVLLIDRRYGISYQGMRMTQESGHWSGEFLSIKVNDVGFWRSKKSQVLLEDAAPVLSTQIPGTFGFYPHEITSLDKSRQSYIKRDGDMLEGGVFLETSVSRANKPDRWTVEFSCKIVPVDRKALDICMGGPVADDWQPCTALSGNLATRKVERKFCWDYPNDCREFLAVGRQYSETEKGKRE